jgi:glycosyltransferase involved in cell wall biosynthesis
MLSKKIYLQYPWAFPDSPYYKYLVDSPPKGFEFINADKQKGVITSYKKFWFSNFLKRNIRRFISSFNLPLINAHKSLEGDCDIIHCAHCLSKNQNKPWVADIEMVSSILLTHHKSFLREKRALRILNNENCKRIMPWTEYAKNDLIKVFPEIKNKIEVVYPAISLNFNKTKKKNKKKLTILYATRYFWIKGGLIALEVYRKIKERFGDKVDLIFVSDVPKEIRQKYPEIKISSLVDSDKMKELYEKSDIFFYPSFIDTFGFGILEAMSYGIPVISLNTFHTKTRKEIIENNKHGFIFDVEEKEARKIIELKEKLIIQTKEEKIINQLFEDISKLIENNQLREEMSFNCINEVKNGKFSIKERNKKLKRIYEESLRQKIQ